MRIFLICPVRKRTEAMVGTIRAYTDTLARAGHRVYEPRYYTQQMGREIDICAENLVAMRLSDEVHIIWDGQSQGCLFDLGMAFVLGKPLVAVTGCVPRMTSHKSFANLIYQLENEVPSFKHGPPPTDPAAEEAYDRWAQTEAQHEADELQAEAAMEGEFADMMALALTDDLPDDLQDICDHFI